MKIMILCGGLGTRLRPLTYKTPKPMLPVDGKPILYYVITNLKRSGFSEFILTVGYLKNQIEDYFGNGEKLGVNIEYLEEEEEQNTAGSILPYKNKIDETFAVVMGDHLTNVDMKKMAEFHKKNNGIATIALQQYGTKIDYGVVDIKSNEVTGFREKPIVENLINTGMYVFEPEIYKYIEEKEDFAHDVFPRLMKNKKKISAYLLPDHWFDIGRISDYENAKELLKKLSVKNHQSSRRASSSRELPNRTI